MHVVIFLPKVGSSEVEYMRLLNLAVLTEKFRTVVTQSVKIS